MRGMLRRHRGTQAAARRALAASATGQSSGLSLMTPLGLLAGDVLMFVERQGRMTMAQLLQEVKGPASMVLMAVGSLIRQGLVRAIQQDVDVIVEPCAVEA